MGLSRRTFLTNSALAYGSALIPHAAPANSLSQTVLAGTVLDRIRQHVGVPWKTPTVDNLLSGTRETRITGVATTMMATFAVCKRAKAQGCNLIITHETPFYLHQDRIDDLLNNPVLKAKQAWLADNDVALFHFHDHLHSMQPDGVARGMIKQLGWESRTTSPDLKHLAFGGLALQEVAAQVASRLGAETIRVVGDPRLPVQNAQTSWGYCGREGGIAILSDPSTELLLCGETREWELVEYVQDAITAGQKKALILIGHVLSEQGGMLFATEWLKGFVPEVPVKFIAAPEPFWRPDAPRPLPA